MSRASVSRFFFASDHGPFVFAAVSSAATEVTNDRFLYNKGVYRVGGHVGVFVVYSSLGLPVATVGSVMIEEMAFDLSMFFSSMLFRFVGVRSLLMSPSMKHFFHPL